jgi:hypothetical protein
MDVELLVPEFKFCQQIKDAGWFGKTYFVWEDNPASHTRELKSIKTSKLLPPDDSSYLYPAPTASELANILPPTVLVFTEKKLSIRLTLKIRPLQREKGWRVGYFHTPQGTTQANESFEFTAKNIVDAMAQLWVEVKRREKASTLQRQKDRDEIWRNSHG